MGLSHLLATPSVGEDVVVGDFALSSATTQLEGAPWTSCPGAMRPATWSDSFFRCVHAPLGDPVYGPTKAVRPIASTCQCSFVATFRRPLTSHSSNLFFLLSANPLVWCPNFSAFDDEWELAEVQLLTFPIYALNHCRAVFGTSNPKYPEACSHCGLSPTVSSHRQCWKGQSHRNLPCPWGNWNGVWSARSDNQHLYIH